MKEHFEQVKANAASTVDKYQASLVQLQETPIHPGLAKAAGQTLASVYHDVSKMEKWRKSCEVLQNQIERKIGGSFAGLKRAKDEIVAKNNSVKAFVKEFDAFEGDSEALFRKTQGEIDKFSEEFFGTFADLRRKLAVAADNLKQGWILLNSSDAYQAKAETFRTTVLPRLRELVGQCSRSAAETFAVFSKNLRQISDNKASAREIFRSLETLNGEFDSIRKQESERLERDYSFLLKPIIFPSAYFSMLKEVNRRKESFGVLKQIVESVGEFVSRDNAQRREFLARYGTFLPESISALAPTLKELMSCKVVANFEEVDRLPVLDDLEAYLEAHQAASETPLASDRSVTQKNLQKSGLLPETPRKATATNELEKIQEIVAKGREKEPKNGSQVLDERRLMEKIDLENQREELEAYKAIFRAGEAVAGSQSAENLKKALLEGDLQFRKALGEILLQNARVVIESIEKVLKKQIKPESRAPEADQALADLTSNLQEATKKLTKLGEENTRLSQTVEGLKTDKRRLELMVEQLEAKHLQTQQRLSENVESVLRSFQTGQRVDLQQIKGFLGEQGAQIRDLVHRIRSRLATKLIQKPPKPPLEVQQSLTWTHKRQEEISELKNSSLSLVSLSQIVAQLPPKLPSKSSLHNLGVSPPSPALRLTYSDSPEETDGAWVLCVPFEKGRYIPFWFPVDFMGTEKQQGKSRRPLRIFQLVEFHGISTAKAVLIEENSFLVVGKIAWEKRTSNVVSRLFGHSNGGFGDKMDTLPVEVSAILSFNPEKMQWFNLG